MQKVLVIGCPGAGKSTFARALRDRTGLPLHYLDCLWHRADGTHTTPEAFDAALAAVMDGPAWIIDGNYLRTMEPRLAACDTVFFLDFPLEVCLAGVENRRGAQRPDMPWVEEELDAEFLQYILDFGQAQLPAIRAMLEPYRGRRQVFAFHSRAEADAWLNALAVTLRPYRPEDCPALAALFYETVHTVCTAHYTPAQLDAWAPAEGPDLAAWDDGFRAHVTLVAELDGQLVGFGDLDPAAGYLDRLYVSRAFQRRGVASALCDALEGAARSRPIITHASRTARPFFERRGYRVIRAQQVERRGVQLENFVMEKG
ncbi:GNAT family N-acetyltransferase [Faecalibacterium sp. An122]|uniref:GNAT family N-acetyltransferase n=1 Tax=Faecalibacterium sp. An122 TaxID=1965551 RepID=UPI0026B7FA17